MTRVEKYISYKCRLTHEEYLALVFMPLGTAIVGRFSEEKNGKTE